MIRFLSGIVLIAVVFTTIWYAPPWLFLTVVIGFLAVAFLEYSDLVAKTGLRVPRVAGVGAAAVVAVTIGWPGLPLVTMIAAVLVAACLVILGRSAPGVQVPGSAAAMLFPVLYLGVPLGLMAAVRTQYGREALLFAVVLVIVSDTAQFYVGTWLGRHRLAPAVSPKKSVEGAVAGLVAGALVAAFFGRVAWPVLGSGWVIALGVVLAALGIAGDLFESLLKRSAELKDSSSLIPGHGGVLDRIDSLLLVVPGYYVFLQLLN